MKNTFYLLVLTIVLQHTSFAQEASCDQLKTEVEYLRKVLKIQNEPIFKDVINGIEIKITKIEGSIRAQTIIVEGLFTPLKPNLDRAHAVEFFAVDLEGTSYNQGGNTPEFPMYQDVPVKFTFNIDRINPNVSTLRILQFKFICLDKNTNGWLSKEVIYKNVKVDWK